MMACIHCKDRYVWRVIYHNGNTFDECNNDGTEHHGFAEVQQDAVAAIIWQQHDTRQDVLRILIPEDSMPVLFRRNLTQLRPDGESVKYPVIYGLGWTSPSNETYLFGLPDNSVLVATDRNAV